MFYIHIATDHQVDNHASVYEIEPESSASKPFCQKKEKEYHMGMYIMSVNGKQVFTGPELSFGGSFVMLV